MEGLSTRENPLDGLTNDCYNLAHPLVDTLRILWKRTHPLKNPWQRLVVTWRCLFMLSAQPLPHPLPHLNGAGDQARAIVSTLIYFDLFAFPPSSAELERFAHRSDSDGHFGACDLAAESAWWSSRGGYFFLKGREDLYARRAEMIEASAPKLKRARRLARWLQVVPGIRFIGVTGSLSMESSVAEDDIDLLFITARDRMWLTRAVVLAALWAIGVKRADDGRSEHPDHVCANIFLEEDDLEIRDHNIFIAHEICQMLPLLGPSAYQLFIEANTWVCEYLPQWRSPAAKWEDQGSLRFLRRVGELALKGPLGRHLEQLFMQRQIARIKKKHARGHNVGVKLSPTQLRFHPHDLSKHVVNTFEVRWGAIQSNGHSVDGPDSIMDESLQGTHA
jgi:hypothetical protein